MVDTLIDIIGREAALFERFLLLLEQQQHALVNNDHEELNRVTAEQQHVLAESRRFNIERERVLDQIKRENAIEGDLTVTRLLEMIDESRADRLSTLRDAILDLNERIFKVRNQNAMLLNKSREYIRKTMDMLARIASPPTGTYTAAGTGAPQAGSFALDRRA